MLHFLQAQQCLPKGTNGKRWLRVHISCSQCAAPAAAASLPRHRSWVGEETSPEASSPIWLMSPTGLIWPAASGWKRALV
jgi:hypothetical protein